MLCLTCITNGSFLDTHFDGKLKRCRPLSFVPQLLNVKLGKHALAKMRMLGRLAQFREHLCRSLDSSTMPPQLRKQRKRR
mmetsp:Transcript_58808/g.127748  ORF Transcript_58808/g.127748 Transcript_58808/m.127748 type:complete len:80 (+) Transcript_58808:239-478(+)